MKYDYATDKLSRRHIIVTYKRNKFIFSKTEDLLNFVKKKLIHQVIEEGRNSKTWKKDVTEAANFAAKTFRVKRV